ncbi:hypothetical protein V7S43_012705 [Phytophthora oleae]|uniref:Reverse transcriptase Ty1/copia-type domain-containing protein n=1 Tax=Phytophthora oleae TaxID=2107226 RepID=A0ABD3F6L8_9STRA
MPSRELLYSQRIAPILPAIGENDMVHLRVELQEDTEEEDQEGMDFEKYSGDSIFKLPEAYMAALKATYRTNQDALVAGLEGRHRRGAPSAYQRRVCPLNETIFEHVEGDEYEYQKQRLTLEASIELKDKVMDGVGKADYLIQYKDRMVVVTVAKHCDIIRAKHQNFAVMEAARILNEKKIHYQTIKGICTDLQTWVFVSRQKGAICTDQTSLVVDNGIEVPMNFESIVNKVYGMLVRL